MRGRAGRGEGSFWDVTARTTSVYSRPDQHFPGRSQCYGNETVQVGRDATQKGYGTHAESPGSLCCITGRGTGHFAMIDNPDRSKDYQDSNPEKLLVQLNAAWKQIRLFERAVADRDRQLKSV